VLPAIGPIAGGDTVTASGEVVPVQYAELGLPIGGVVAEVLVTEGDEVEAGQLLIRLVATQQMASAAQAEASLRQAQIQLDRLRTGPDPQEIEAELASVEAAKAELAKLMESAQPEELAAAEAALVSARTALQTTLEGADENEVTIAAADLRRAEVDLKQAQWAYDEVAFGDDVGESPQAAQLEQATLDYQTAMANYYLAVDGPSPDSVEAARAQLAQAESNLAILQRGPSDAQIAIAEANTRYAQAQLNLVKAGARPEDIAAAETEVVSAQAVLTGAQAALTNTELRAPFAGAVTTLRVSPGEVISPVPDHASLTLVDLTHLRVETTDLSERDVAEVALGQPASVYVEALGLEMQGSVARIAQEADIIGGDVVYKVVVELNEQPPGLRWGMSADVRITTE
jgi:HlyD family secretion protein